MSDEKRSEDEKDDKAEVSEDASAKEGPEGAASAAAEADADVAVVDRPADTTDGSGSEDDDDDDDAANPAAIARRVAALGADDATEEFAREEERKLAERRAAKKKGKKKGGLEVAASKKLSKIGTRAEPKRSIAVAADADPLIERTAKLSEWAKKHQTFVQIAGAVLCVGLLGLAGFLYYDNKRETEASTILTKAVEAQRAQIGEPKKDDDDDNRQLHFKTFEDRRAAALKQYKEVQSKFPGTGAAILARLAEGSILLDNRDADGAVAAFNDVKGSALAAADTEVRGRALEGLGFAHELKAETAPAEKDKALDAALAAYKEMETAANVKGFKELAMYHQARVLMNKGDKDKAKEVLLALKERLNVFEEPLAAGLPMPPSFPYLKDMAMDRLHEIDPAAAPKKSHPGATGGGMNLTPAQLRKMMEEMQKRGGH